MTHYFIDGYNLLFRLVHDGEDLQSERDAIILDLNKKFSLLKLDASIVFDAAFQTGGRTRAHYDALEILYTAEGESADEYILEEVRNSSDPRQETVVTSDKALAQRVRLSYGHTQSVEEFIQWLNRVYRNKLRQIKNGKFPPQLPAKPQAKSKSILPASDAPLEAYADYYHHIFEQEWLEIQKKETPPKTTSKSTPRRPRQKKDTFQQAPSPEEKEATEMERWLRIFEKRTGETKGD